MRFGFGRSQGMSDMPLARVGLVVALLAGVAVAQQDDDAATTTRAAQTTARVTNAQQTTARTTAAATTTGRANLSNLPDLTAQPSTSLSSINLSAAPSLSSSTRAGFSLGDLPTIAGVGIPTMVIPNTENAPFKQRSDLPEGTVFIIVGAILGFMGMCILAWRGLVAWSLHRSVRKAARATYDSNNDSKTLLANASKSGVYGMSTLGGTSNMSVDKPTGLRSIPGGRLTKSGPSLSSLNTNVGRNSNLFFSPTAGAGNHSASGMGTPGNRSSNFLPAGYYTTASAISPASGAPSAHLGGGPSPLAHLNPLSPARAGYAPQRNFSASPPESPALHPRPSGDNMQRAYNSSTPVNYQPPTRNSSAHMYSQSSVSNLNLYTPGGAVNGGRAPSANLEELFDSRGNRY